MIVVGCGKRKRAQASPARELYTGSLFLMARRYAEASGQPWVILSGAHGVIEPEWIIRPYDAGPPASGEALRQWARKAALEIEQRRSARPSELLLGSPVEILAGVQYAGPLAAALDRLDIDSVQPLANLVLGRRLQRLRAMADSLQARAGILAREKGREKNG